MIMSKKLLAVSMATMTLASSVVQGSNLSVSFTQSNKHNKSMISAIQVQPDVAEMTEIQPASTIASNSNTNGGVGLIEIQPAPTISDNSGEVVDTNTYLGSGNVEVDTILTGAIGGVTGGVSDVVDNYWNNYYYGTIDNVETEAYRNYFDTLVFNRSEIKTKANKTINTLERFLQNQKGTKSVTLNLSLNDIESIEKVLETYGIEYNTNRETEQLLLELFNDVRITVYINNDLNSAETSIAFTFGETAYVIKANTVDGTTYVNSDDLHRFLSSSIFKELIISEYYKGEALTDEAIMKLYDNSTGGTMNQLLSYLDNSTHIKIGSHISATNRPVNGLVFNGIEKLVDLYSSSEYVLEFEENVDLPIFDTVISAVDGYDVKTSLVNRGLSVKMVHLGNDSYVASAYGTFKTANLHFELLDGEYYIDTEPVIELLKGALNFNPTDGWYNLSNSYGSVILPYYEIQSLTGDYQFKVADLNKVGVHFDDVDRYYARPVNVPFVTAP